MRLRAHLQATTTRHILIGFLVVAVVAYSVFSLFRSAQEDQVVSQTTYLPDFQLPDAEGGVVQLSAIEAKVRVVNFWASWSPYSRDELHALVRLKQEYGDAVAIVALNRDTYPSEGRVFLASLALGPDLTFAYDREDTYFKEVGGYNMPETIFVGQRQEVLHHVHGPMTYEEMRGTLETLLAR